MSIQRVTAGVPTGGQYAAHPHDESSVMLSDHTEPSTAPDYDPVVVGADPQSMTVAQARRDLPEGQRVQVVYLNGADQAEPDVRTVTKQTSTEMITTGKPGSRAESGSHLSWSKLKAQRDDAGNILISNADGIPIAAYVPLSDGAPGSATVVQLQATDDIAKAKESVDDAELHALAGSNLAAVRERVANNAATGRDTLHYLAADGDVKVQRALANNPRSSGSALARLKSTTTDNQARYAIAAHANVHPGTLNEMSLDEGAGVRAAAARNTSTPSETLHRMVESERNSDVRTSLSQNPKTPAADLESMSRGSGFTMAGVARNPSTPEAALRRLSTDTLTDNHVRAQVAANPSAPVDVISQLAAEPDGWVRKHAAGNPSLPSPWLRALSDDGDNQVRRAAAGNPNAAPAVLAGLSRDDEVGVRAAAAGNTNTESADLERMARDESHWVRKNVAGNAATRPEVVHLLAQEEGVVGLAASKSVRERGLAS
jgi:hypothetical protein